MISWPKNFIRPHEGDNFWISIDITERPFKHTKTNFKYLMIVSAFFKHVKIFVPIFFAMLQEGENPDALSKPLIKFRTEILEQYQMIPTQITSSPEPALIAAI